MKKPKVVLSIGFYVALATLCTGQQDETDTHPDNTLKSEQLTNDISSLVDWILADKTRLEAIPFGVVVYATSGYKVLPTSIDQPVDAAVIDAVAHALSSCLEYFSQANNPIHQVTRVNEISRHIETFLLRELNAVEGLQCSIPVNASGDFQRSGYPDLRILHEASGQVFYVDPKVYKLGSEQSSFRTFYFEPKKATNKILEDAKHLILGIAHTGKEDGKWLFDGWKIVDLSTFKVRLKAEFQASNRDLYIDKQIIRESIERK